MDYRLDSLDGLDRLDSLDRMDRLDRLDRSRGLGPVGAWTRGGWDPWGLGPMGREWDHFIEIFSIDKKSKFKSLTHLI